MNQQQTPPSPLSYAQIAQVRTRAKWLVITAIGVGAVFVLAAIVSTAGCDIPAPTNATAASGDPLLEVSRDDLGEKWPLTVDRGQIRVRNEYMVTFVADGTEYALNGTAQPTYPEIRPIWRDKADQRFGGPKVNIGPLLDAGLALRAGKAKDEILAQMHAQRDAD